MNKKCYQSPEVFSVLTDVFCDEESFPMNGSPAEIANAKEANIDFFEEGDDGTGLEWFDNEGPWQQ